MNAKRDILLKYFNDLKELDKELNSTKYKGVLTRLCAELNINDVDLDKLLDKLCTLKYSKKFKEVLEELKDEIGGLKLSKVLKDLEGNNGPGLSR